MNDMRSSMFLLCLLTLFSAGSLSAEIAGSDFEKDFGELPAEEAKAITKLVRAAKADQKMILRIPQRTLHQKPASLDYMREKIRALRIFQEMVRQGIDPACVEFVQVFPSATQKQVSVDSKKGLAKRTKAIVPSNNQIAESQNFSLHFAEGSSVPGRVDPKAFKAFLLSVGQEGHDVLVLESSPDPVGDPVYNKALSDLRALSIYELMTRAGLPPYRVEIKNQSPGNSSDAAGGAFLVHWMKNAAVAEAAARVEGGNFESEGGADAPRSTAPLSLSARSFKSAETEEEATPQTEGTSRTEEISQTEGASRTEEISQAEETSSSQATSPSDATTNPKPRAITGTLQSRRRAPYLDIVPFLGFVSSPSEFHTHVNSSPVFGLGLGKYFWRNQASLVRSTLMLSAPVNFEAKEGDRSGEVKINQFAVQTDFILRMMTWRPFVGIQLGYVSWQGSIEQPSTGLKNERSEGDIKFSLVLGVDWILMTGVIVVPQLEFSHIAGAFNENLISPLLALRWSLQ